MMGCGSSMETQNINEDYVPNGYTPWPSTIEQSANIVQEFVRLDEKIAEEEVNCAAARLSTVEAWIEHLTDRRNEIMGLMPSAVENFVQTKEQTQNSQMDKLDDEISTAAFTVTPPPIRQMNIPSKSTTDTPIRDLVSLALNLGVVNDIDKAATHEDFFANLSEAALLQATIKYYNEIITHNSERLSLLSDSQKALNDLYLKHDGIIAYISGGTYMTEIEQHIDAQLEEAREIRNKLGATMEQWHICGTLLRAGAASATQAMKQWRHLITIQNAQQKLKAALECRDTLSASVVSMECAQQALPQTDLKFITNRQILAVKHCYTYMITDIANPARYNHSSWVFSNYESNISKCSDWLYETFNKTLRNDFDEAQTTINQLALTLRQHRSGIFQAARQ